MLLTKQKILTKLKNFSFKKLYLGFKFSFSYFSILPISFKISDDLSSKEVLASMLFFLPLVGLVLGLGTIILFSFLENLTWLGALISAISYMLLYGFLHTEAVCDVADAIYAFHGNKDAYDIIKEPTVGAMGVLFSTAIMLLKVAGIVFLFLNHYLLEFVAILIISRLSLLLLFEVHEFRSSFATELKKSLTKPYLIASFILFSVIGIMLISNFMTLLLIGLLLALLISYVIKSKIGFVNGDVLGATLEGIEVLLFIFVAI
jgi:adenosylcobinamide-GDP ribazoletransferase